MVMARNTFDHHSLLLLLFLMFWYETNESRKWLQQPWQQILRKKIFCIEMITQLFNYFHTEKVYTIPAIIIPASSLLAWKRQAFVISLPLDFQVTSTDSTQTSFGCLSTEGFPRSPTTCSSGTMWTGGSSPWKQYVFF